MTMTEYMEKYRKSLTDLSYDWDISLKLVWRYKKGINLPSAKNMYKIYRKTKRKINLKDWFDESGSTRY